MAYSKCIQNLPTLLSPPPLLPAWTKEPCSGSWIIVTALGSVFQLLHGPCILFNAAESDTVNIQVKLCHSPVQDPPIVPHLTQSKKPKASQCPALCLRILLCGLASVPAPLALSCSPEIPGCSYLRSFARAVPSQMLFSQVAACLPPSPPSTLCSCSYFSGRPC